MKIACKVSCIRTFVAFYKLECLDLMDSPHGFTMVKPPFTLFILQAKLSR